MQPTAWWLYHGHSRQSSRRSLSGRDSHRWLSNGQKGQGRRRVGIAALDSFFAGSVATIALAAAGPTLSSFAFSFGPAEYVALCIFGLLAATILAHGSVVKAIDMVCLGLVLGMPASSLREGE